MFLNFIKNFYIKYTLKNKWLDLSNPISNGFIQTVGLLIDTSTFTEKDQLIQELVVKGFLEKNISVLEYSDLLSKKDIQSRSSIDASVLSWSGSITNEIANQFIATQFDVLISYYEIEKPVLLLITNHSKAHFKIGFSSVDKRFNHLMLTTSLSTYTIFVQELFKYLKILNKIES